MIKEVIEHTGLPSMSARTWSEYLNSNMVFTQSIQNGKYNKLQLLMRINQVRFLCDVVKEKNLN